MKSVRLLLTTVAVSLAAPSIGAEETPSKDLTLEQAQVTLPYQELRQLWEAAQPKKPSSETKAPPLEVSISSVDYVLRLNEEPPKLQVTWQIHQFTNEWLLVPLIGGDLHLQGASAQGSCVSWRDDQFVWVNNTSGAHEIQLDFTLDREALTSPDGAVLTTVDAAAHEFTAAGVPNGQQLHAGSRLLKPNEPCPLPGKQASHTLTLSESTPNETSQTSVWRSQSENLVCFGSDGLLVTSRTFLSADDGSGEIATLKLPATSSEVRVTSRDLHEWSLGPIREGYREIQVRWETPGVLARSLHLTYNLALPPFRKRWPIAAPVTDESGRHDFIMIPPRDSQLEAEGLQSAVPVETLSPWLREILEQDTVDRLTLDQSAATEMSVIPAVPKAAAPPIVKYATFGTRIVADGSMLVTATYHITHETAVNWTVSLPPDTEILTAKVANTSTVPEVHGEDLISFSLSSPSDGVTRVTFQYTAKRTPLDKVAGHLNLDLPQTETFIDALTWEVAVPAAYAIEALDGNLEASEAPCPEGISFKLVKELCRNERPAVAVYYRRKGINQ